MAECLACGLVLDPRKRLRVCNTHGWEATPGPQTDFLATTVFESLYGGQAGGGKTDALVMRALRGIEHPNYNAIIFRRTFPELIGQVIPKSWEWYPKLGATYNKVDHVWTFPSGARIHFGHLQHADDVHRYQGWEFQDVAFDELTTFLESQYRYLIGRIRSAHGIRGAVAGATNPGGEGHEWVLRRWEPWLRARDPDYKGPRARPGEPMWFVSKDEGRVYVSEPEAREINDRWNAASPEVRVGMPRALQTVFVPARLTDNPHLLDNDPEYAARLADNDAHTKRQLLEGDWLSKPSKRDFFQREWFPVVDAPPVGRIVWCRWWDRAATEKKEKNDPDFTAHVKMGRCEDGSFIIADAEEFREKPAVVASRLEEQAKVDGKGVMVRGAKDPGSAGEFEAASYVRALAGYDVEFMRETGDKADRARPVSSQAKALNIKVLRGHWNRAFFDRIEQFPIGHDDMVDAMSGAFSVLNSDAVFARVNFKGAMAALRGGVR